MAKISGLIFSADPIKETLAAAEHLLEFTDEVVTIYSGTNAENEKLKHASRGKKIRIYNLIRTGYPEPFRHYGIMLCKYKNIAMLDVDERFSDTKYVKILINSNKSDIYRIWRHEITEGKLQSNLYTKQYRLFRKGSIEWKGLLHETPITIGSVVDIPKNKLCLIHKTGKAKPWNYDKLNEVFPAERPVKLAIRDAYVERAFKHLSMAKTLALFLKKYKKHKSDANLMDRTSKDIVCHLRKEGIIRYLNLNDKKTVALINSRYKNSKEQGIDLLIKILYDKYNEKI